MKIRTVATIVLTTIALSACSDRQSPTSPLKAPGRAAADVTVSTQATLNAQIDTEINALFFGFARTIELSYWNWIVAHVSNCSSATTAQKIDADFDALVAFTQANSKYFSSTKAQRLVQLLNDMSTYIDNALALCGTPDA